MLQQHSGLKTIKKKLIQKALDMIRRIVDEDPDEFNDKHKKDVEESSDIDEKKRQYTKLWNEFGKSIKLGIIEDATNRNRLAKLLRFERQWKAKPSMKVSFNSSRFLNAEIMYRLALDQNLFVVFYGVTQEANKVLVVYEREDFDLVPDLIDATTNGGGGVSAFLYVFRHKLCR
ncbi:hypothetical protein U1Q18_011004 [Sarracenia purpurea var. burkii]